MLTELEILKLRELGKAKNIALHQQMVDMAVALKNRRVIEYFLILAKNYGFNPYLLTFNAGPLIKLLSAVRHVRSNLVVVTSEAHDEGVKRYMKISHLHFIHVETL